MWHGISVNCILNLKEDVVPSASFDFSRLFCSTSGIFETSVCSKSWRYGVYLQCTGKISVICIRQ